ncbi:hypothetical protein E4U43_002071 [Claviceps pusilla]|uniref:Uncharacterized protein n=1 Tax=Claviceps pusilla TaxID=123648 RepID=A0A9P7N811_9HYPO|nr:hypothetical protein E4U43_002071 [Claviceps pusilla]
MPPLQLVSEAVFNGDGHIMGPRINSRRDVTAPQNPTARTIWNVLRRGEKACHSGSDYDTCEKGINTNITNLAIILGVVNVKRLRQEDAQDPHKGLDFGMGDSNGKGGKRKSLFGLGAEKLHHRNNQLSMDMNLSSPYLLPPAAGSKESVHTLARTLPADQDPYRTVKQYANSDAGSIRSYKPGRDASLYRGKTPGSVLSSRMGSQRVPPSRSDSIPNASSSDAKSDPFATPTSPKATHQFPAPEDVQNSGRPIEPVIPEIGSVSHSAQRTTGPDVPEIRPPPRVLTQESSQYVIPSLPFEHDGSLLADDSTASNEGHMATTHADTGRVGPAGLGLKIEVPKIYSPDEYGVAGGDPGQALSYDDYGHAPAQPREHQEQQQQQQQQFQQGLGVPQQSMKRLSVGFRPLPPDEVMDSEDPEYRANRIRSFYKEYFDEGKEAPPPMPGHAQEYHEDYDSSYLGDEAYYDAANNAFVMPYAQPVTRRAMTPPPAGRFRGGPGGPGPHGPPRGGPRGPGSVGAMSLPGGPRGRPRAGSAACGPRPGSSASMGPRGRPMKKNLPPPAPLPTLPIPSKLKDDAFAILNAADFAPPDSFREQADGRSQSPLGERRQYQLKVPVASPLVTSFDELSALPSPHVLRKSSTFTNLDFAPPKKFKDADTTSDAGSIRSNKSGISPAQLDAIRRGAGRVSRLPGDTVFTTAASGDTLKPSWDMRA